MDISVLPLGSLAKLRQYKKALELAQKTETAASRKKLAQQIKRLKKRARQAATLKSLAADSARYRKLLLAAGSDCLTLVMSIVRDLVGEQAKLDSEGLKHRIKVALKSLAISKDFCITLNPNDTAAIDGCRSSDTIKRGHALIDTPGGSIVLNLEDQLNNIQALILSRLAQQVSEEPR